MMTLFQQQSLFLEQLQQHDRASGWGKKSQNLFPARSPSPGARWDSATWAGLSSSPRFGDDITLQCSCATVPLRSTCRDLGSPIRFFFSNPMAANFCTIKK
ncbi:unnamed protein product [Prunus armeniaca]